MGVAEMYSTQTIDHKQITTLFVRLPHVIRNRDEVKTIFFGDIKIRFPKPTSRHCLVTFPTVKEALKNLKALRNKTINGKRIFAYLLRSELPVMKKRMKNMKTKLKTRNYVSDRESEEESTDSNEDSEDTDNAINYEIKNSMEETAIEE